MAKSGSNTTSIGNYLHLRLEWETLSQEVSNNRSKVRLTLKLIQNGTGIWFSANKTGVLHGESFTYTGGFSGTGTKTLRTRDVWVNHNSDGSKSQSFSATFNIAISYSGSHRSSMSVSTTASLDAIPRASTLTAFSFPSSLQGGTATQINYTVDRKHGNFRHRVQLRDGSTVIQTWDNQNTNGSSNVQLSNTSVNTLLNRMTTVTSKSLTLRIDTRSSSGGGFIGSASSRNATASIHSNVRPTITATSVSEAVSGLNTQFGGYVQNKSKLSLSMSASGTYGSTIRSYSIKANGTTYTSKTATTAELKNSGSQSVTFEATDSRGRKTPITTVNISVTAYSEPKITKINAVRSNSDGTVNEEGSYAKVSVTASISPVGNKNTKSFKVRSRASGSTTWAEQTITVTGYSVDTDVILPNISTDLSYEIEAVVADWFTSISAKSNPNISTAFTLMNFKPDGKGISFGGVYEDAMGGLAQFKGPTNFKELVRFGGGIDSIYILPNSDLNDFRTTGFYHNPSNADVATMLNVPVNQAFSLLVEEHAGTKQTVTLYGGGTEAVNTYVRNYYNGKWGEWEKVTGQRGSNSNGQWVRYGDGLQICWNAYLGTQTATGTAMGTLFQSGGGTWNFPMEFHNDTPLLHVGARRFRGGTAWGAHSGAMNTAQATGLRMISQQADTVAVFQLMAVGRWK